MQQIKFFKGVENELAALEDEINTWLVESEAKVLHIVGNIAPQTHSGAAHATGLSKSEFPPSDVLIAIVYDRLQ